VPHVHIHLMPLNKPGDLNFGHHVEMSPDELAAMAQKIAAAIE
jgi:diadenosine tetraphosphate (Ap4A) HIT family hydrolase